MMLGGTITFGDPPVEFPPSASGTEFSSPLSADAPCFPTHIEFASNNLSVAYDSEAQSISGYLPNRSVRILCTAWCVTIYRTESSRLACWVSFETSSPNSLDPVTVELPAQLWLALALAVVSAACVIVWLVLLRGRASSGKTWCVVSVTCALFHGAVTFCSLLPMGMSPVLLLSLFPVLCTVVCSVVVRWCLRNGHSDHQVDQVPLKTSVLKTSV
eukprot:TRINITY_DN11584_c0_g2_i2.p1 TRINITY_DN11584_c0_g2~~TRINITY_DN11584_c0_g2_i2.p1  ORF type:complete len:215 (-),score=22.47 TRINITY_DN11584_c0_g2_i2:75-719(-)